MVGQVFLMIVLGGGEVEIVGKALSNFVSHPIITISYFDDDVFDMNIYFNGEYLTGQLWCNHKDMYELDDKHADIHLLSGILGNQHYEKI
ncbi:hypothetical protein [Chengkuizengella axinellae]|uniref:Uncharacterized protein n=1 Tax=Chengkuizengella axinellae TaxID=3064388 RepID=A0ABT9J0I4_9BACL|nr:hypothetical protein [Chengkuizengella sp. 2205SS18-9]MDP5275124.1 hypothetical protein [Chengkuizengella sp. 2205SS18-9]